MKSGELDIELGDWSNMSLSDIADILNKSEHFSKVSYSESCAECCELVKERRYKADFKVVSVSGSGMLNADGYPRVATFYSNYDIQVYLQKLTVFNVVEAGLKMHAHHLNDKIIYESYLVLLRNGDELSRVYFEVNKNKIRVINGIEKRAGYPRTYLGEVELDLPDPNDLDDTDKIEIKLVTSMDVVVGGGKAGLITSTESIEILHEEFEYAAKR